MKAVMLDTASLGEDVDLSSIRDAVDAWERYPNTSPTEVAARLQDADIVLTNKVVLNAEVIRSLPKLRLICVMATGVNNVDTQAAEECGVTVRSVEAYGTASVAQHTLMLLLALANRLPLYQREVAAGRWQTSEQFCLMNHSTMQLAGKRLVIVGEGELGKEVARLAQSFHMEVSFAARPGSTGDKRPSLTSLAPKADAISLHCPLTDQTRNLVDTALLTSVKPGCLLINCARGGIVDDNAALSALRSGRLGGLGVDVLPEEPPRRGHPLLSALDIPLNLIITPHNAWITPESRQTIVNKTAQNIVEFRGADKPK